MNLINRFLRRTTPANPKVVFLGIDGTPLSFLQRMMRQGQMPNMAQLAQEGSLVENRSVYPTVSSVAWSSFMTGVNPAKHGIFGFIDRPVGSLKPFIPTGRNMQARTLWEILSEAGKRVIVMNVPVTYPPKPVNGALVSGFLAPRLEVATYPAELAEELSKLGYILDVDPWRARADKRQLLADVDAALEGRERALFHLMDQGPWDYAHCHIMETDRLHHFLWEEMEAGHPEFAPRFFDFYRRLDGFIGRVRQRLESQTTLMIMSDHGFCTLRQEVYVNKWLADMGWLKYATQEPKGLPDIAPESRAFSLDPGRIYVNLKGREPQGSVSPGAEYERLCDEILQAALALRDPESGEPMVERAMRTRDIYQGPLLDQAADIILHPHRGYDLKGPIHRNTLTYKGDELVGMHTYDDALFYISGHQVSRNDVWVADPMPTVLRLLGVPVPDGLDGRSLVS